MGFIESRQIRKAERDQLLRSSTQKAVESLNEEKSRAIIPDVAPIIVTERVAEEVRKDMHARGERIIFLTDKKVRKTLEQLSSEKVVKPRTAKDQLGNEVKVWIPANPQKAVKKSLSRV
jgi:hypothetical protein